jgi:hypothetical protein
MLARELLASKAEVLALLVGEVQAPALPAPRPDSIHWLTRSGVVLVRFLGSYPRVPYGSAAWRLPGETGWRQIGDLPPEWNILPAK